MKTAFFAVALLLSHGMCFSGGVPSSSVMASGDWYKIAVERDGVYRITYSELAGLGIADPANVRIYGSGGAMLPERADSDFESDLKEIPIWMHARNDGTFQSGDYILFYGQGPTVWRYDAERREFEHSIHLWDNYSYYFITSKAGGKRIAVDAPPSASPSQTVTAFDERMYHEKELLNLVNSGRHWYGERFHLADARSRSFPFAVPDLEPGSAASLNIAFMAQTTSASAQLSVACNGQQIAVHPLPATADFYQSATATSFSASFHPSSDNLSVELSLSNASAAYTAGYLDYIRLFARRRLNMSSPQLLFRDTQSVGEGLTARFQITGCSSSTHVWDITDMHDVRRVSAALSGSVLSFSAAADELREYVAFDASAGWLRPTFPERNRRTANQDLHGIKDAEMVIVTHPDFLDAARELAALHGERDGLSVAVVIAEQVYNEFSSGKQDPAAIRNFMKRLRERQSDVKLQYLLLMGAGSFDNKGNRAKQGWAVANTNFIVTYQSVNSWHETNSYVSDDYFGILDDNEAVETGKLVIGAGRLPVRTAEQARELVAKTRRYMDSRQAGDWPNKIGLIADDGDRNLHANQSETLAREVGERHPQIAVEKLYLDAFPRVATADGHRFPEVTHRLENILNDGCLLVNYIGHGNESGLSAARVVNFTSIGQWKNKLYPLFVAATCQFGRYDSDALSGGESMMLSPHGGSIATLTGTRYVYSSYNFEFNRNFVRELLVRTNDNHRLGDVLRRAKNASSSSEYNVNKLNFALLGNPALRLPVPEDSVITVAINGKSLNEPLDTLKANSRVTVRGAVADAEGRVQTGFNGSVHFSLFDKEREHLTLNGRGDAAPMPFTTQTSVLFKGRAAVKNGEFEITFVIPRNINYRFGTGKITYYACSDDGRIAAGSFGRFVVGGSVPGADYSDGPEIRLFMNDTLFRDGGVTDQNPRLIALLRDETGINTSDEGIGHQITAALSHEPSKVYTLNRFYEAKEGCYKSGTVSYRFSSLPAGEYELRFTASNLQNYASQASIRFRVTHSSALHIDKLQNYPNPFADHTRIYFEHNMPDAKLQAELQIFDLSGRLLRTVKQSLTSGGYTSGEFGWDGRDANGNRVNAGVYPYRVTLRTAKGETVWRSGRMVIL